MSSVTELFALPSEIREILAGPFAEWSEEDYEHIFTWLYDSPRRAYLREIAARTWVSLGATTTEGVDEIVEEFYSRRVGRLIRRARFRNVAAVFLVEFEKFLRNAFKSVDYQLPVSDQPLYYWVGPRSGIEGELPATTRSSSLSSGTASPPTRRPRLSQRDRILLAWASSEPSSTALEKGAADWVETSVFGPRKVARGRHFLLQAFAHRPDQASVAERLAIQFDEETETLGIRTLGAKLLPDTRLTFSLALPGLSVVEPVQEMVWTGKTEGVAFGVEVSMDHRVGNVIGTVTVAVDSIPIGRITIKLEIKLAGEARSIKTDALEAITTDARRYAQAFISYASPDRNKVLARVQMLPIQGIEFFQDLLSLEPGLAKARRPNWLLTSAPKQKLPVSSPTVSTRCANERSGHPRRWPITALYRAGQRLLVSHGRSENPRLSRAVCLVKPRSSRWRSRTRSVSARRWTCSAWVSRPSSNASSRANTKRKPPRRRVAISVMTGRSAKSRSASGTWRHCSS